MFYDRGFCAAIVVFCYNAFELGNLGFCYVIERVYFSYSVLSEAERRSR